MVQTISIEYRVVDHNKNCCVYINKETVKNVDQWNLEEKIKKLKEIYRHDFFSIYTIIR